MATTNYNTTGFVTGDTYTRQGLLAADTYYPGMPLQYDFTVPSIGTADVSNVGDGTVTAVSQVAGVPLIIGVYILELVAAVVNGGVFKLTDPNGNVMNSNLSMTAGAGLATAFTVGGLRFTITDGATDFTVVLPDSFTITVTEGSYAYLTDGQLDGFFMESESRVLAAPGTGTIFVGGMLQEGGIVDDSGVSLAITIGDIVNWNMRGFKVQES